MRRLLMAATLGIALVFIGQASAQEQPSIPTPGPDEIVFVGRVPVPAGTVISLRAFDLDTAHSVVCDEAESTPADKASPGTSQFVLMFEAPCFEGAEGAFICWDPAYQSCDLVAASALAIELYDLRDLHGPGLVSFDDLGQVVDTGLLSVPKPSEPPSPPSTGGAGPVAEPTDVDNESPVAELPRAGMRGPAQPNRGAAVTWSLGAATIAVLTIAALLMVTGLALRRR